MALRSFVEAKHSVANEFDVKQKAKLEQLTYTEMMEAILRLTFYVYEDSELAHLPLAKKLWYMLDPILALVGEFRSDEKNFNDDIPEDETTESEKDD